MCSARAHAPELPRRPDVPPTLYLLAVAVAVEAATLRYVPTAALARLGTPALVAASALSLSCALAALALRTRPGWALACLVAMCAAAAFGLALASAARVDALADELSTSAVSAWTFTVEGGSSAGEHGYTARCRAERDGRPAGSVWLTSAEPLDLRERLTCVGRFRPNGEDDWGRTSRAQGVSGSVRALRLLSREPSPPPLGLVAEARGRVLGSIDPSSSDARAILAGCVCGDRRAMGERGLEDAFSASGVSHLVAVSGSHLALVASIVGALLSGARVGGWRRRVALVAACGLFVAFSGFAASAVRSWAMVACGEAGGALGRRGHATSSACAVCLAMCLADPTLSGQPGFVLSALSVAALSLAVPYAGYALDVAAPTLPRALGPQALRRAEAARRSVRDVLASTLVAQAATAPVVARAFGDLSLVAPLANLLLAPLFVVLMAAGLAAACLAPLPALQA
ncbi:ComEC/Rec2 family competence protein, partial [Atopobiaceae bacterium LCP21S3_F7]